jgi:hypothetical protein
MQVAGGSVIAIQLLKSQFHSGFLNEHLCSELDVVA